MMHLLRLMHLLMRTWIILLLGVPAAPIPPRLPYPVDSYTQRQHLKENSPVLCSRAVSRWVRQAWDIIIKDTFKDDPSFDVTAALRSSCPFREDIYSQHERSKEGLYGTHRCGICHESFKTEYQLDCHLDRRHLFPDLTLPDNYTGGPVREVRKRNSNETVDIDEKSSLLRRSGVCLEDYCQIFDVCDRPPSRKFPVIDNNHSLTHISHSKASSQLERASIVDGDCAYRLLPSIEAQCVALVDNCFSVDSTASPVRRANIYIQRNVCGALQSCYRYTMRRQYAGSSLKYTEAAYLGKLARPLGAMSGLQVALIAIAIIVLIFCVVAGICCCLDAQVPHHNERPHNPSELYNYKSSRIRESASALRRRPFGTSSPSTSSTI